MVIGVLLRVIIKEISRKKAWTLAERGSI